MIWLKKPYIHNSITMPLPVTKFVIEHKRKLSFHVITISDINDGMLDIIPVAAFLAYPKELQKNVMVVGVARNHKQAIELCTEILEDVHAKTGSFFVKDYLKQCFSMD